MRAGLILFCSEPPNRQGTLGQILTHVKWHSSSEANGATPLHPAAYICASLHQLRIWHSSSNVLLTRGKGVVSEGCLASRYVYHGRYASNLVEAWTRFYHMLCSAYVQPPPSVNQLLTALISGLEQTGKSAAYF